MIPSARGREISRPASEDLTHLSERSFSRLARYITNELGIKMPDTKLTMVQSRLMRRVRELGLPSVERYTEYFFDAENAHEREYFINAITTNKTDFFREPEHFDYLVQHAIPMLQSMSGETGIHLKVWSAGCSSGEEPYTLAMVLSEYGRSQSSFDFEILATDVSTRVLNIAQNGIYQQTHVGPVPPEMRKRYLMRGQNQSANLMRIVPALRRKISFHQLNFMKDVYNIRAVFDVIFFRNVMIYFDKPTQEAVIRRLCRCLVPGGYLFAGHSESLAGLDVPLNSVYTAVYRKPLSA